MSDETRVKARALMIAMQIVKEELEHHGINVEHVAIDEIQRAGEELIRKEPELLAMARDQLRRMQ